MLVSFTACVRVVIQGGTNSDSSCRDMKFSSFSFEDVLIFNSSFYDYTRRPLISEDISSFSEAQSPSKTLFSILVDLADQGPAATTS